MSDIKVYVQHHGYLSCDLRWLLVSPSLFGSRKNKNPDAWGDVPTITVVVEHPEGRLLFDTTCPVDWEDRWGPSGLNEIFPYENVKPEQYFVNALKNLKLEPTDFKYVALSHFHFDHAGNIRLFKETGARILATRKERDGAMAIPGAFQGAFIRADYDIGVNYEVLDGDAEIMPGVHLIEVPGHTWGTMALMVHLKNSGTMIFASDAIYMKQSYGPPPVGAAIVYDNLAWLRSVEKIRDLATKHNATVVFGHDPGQIKELRLAPEAYYD